MIPMMNFDLILLGPPRFLLSFGEVGLHGPDQARRSVDTLLDCIPVRWKDNYFTY